MESGSWSSPLYEFGESLHQNHPLFNLLAVSSISPLNPHEPTCHLDPERCLSGHVEADEFYQTAGAKGRPGYVQAQWRAPRRRGLSQRGRGSWEKDQPPILGLVQRRDRDDQGRPEDRPAQVFLEVLPNVQTETIRPIILARVERGSSWIQMITTSTILRRRRAIGIGSLCTVRANMPVAMSM